MGRSKFLWVLCYATLIQMPNPSFSSASIPNQEKHSFVRGEMGAYAPNFSSNIRINNGSDFPEPYQQDVYSTKKNNKPLLGIAAGRRWVTNRKWLAEYELGVRYQYFFKQNIGNDIMQYALPEFTNYNYQWNTQSNAFTVFSKIDLIKIQRVLPYFQAGAGLGLTHTNAYAEQALPNITPRVSPGFQNHHSFDFIYHLGTGIDFIVSPHWVLSIGYEFDYFGTIRSSHGESTWGGERLSIHNAQTNIGMIGMTYLK